MRTGHAAFLAIAAALAGAAGAGLPFAAIAILLLGMPHGAGDLYAVPAGGRAGFVATYLAAAGGVMLLWRVAPDAVLPGFLILSGLHFAADAAPGERWAAALVPVAGPALFHGHAVAELFAGIGADAGVAAMLAGAMRLMALAGVAAAAAAGTRWGAAAWIGTGAALLLPPLPGFAAAFAILHAWPATARCAAAAGLDVPAYLRRVGPAVLGAAGVGLVALLWFRDRPMPGAGALFAFVSALAVPHMLVTPLWTARRRTMPA